VADNEEQFVLVTRATASTGRIIMHTFGPYPTRSKGRSAQRKAHKQAELFDYPLESSVTKIIDDDGEWGVE
jgi:hypothetical protein